VLTRGTFLYDEVRFLLQQELREPRNYFAIVEAIAAGRTRLNEIKQATGLEGVSAYLDTLQGLRLVERVVPVTEGKPHKSRRGLYRLRDHFFRFWFRFVHPNRSLLERGGAQVVLDTFVAPQLDSFTAPVFEEICRICVPDFVCFAEDMCYNHGPMLSKECFDEFLAPYYRHVVPRIRDRGAICFVDCDGDITRMIPWLKEVGIEGALPLERQAGVDVAALRRAHPQFRFIGCYDKMVMNRGEEAMRAEFQRLLPVARRGGLVVSCDHQTPPGVSYQDYQLYLKLFREYAAMV